MLKFSQSSLEILQNFATINKSILFLEGKKQKLLSPTGGLYAEAEIDEEIPKQFGIYDLNKFLGIFSLFDTPNVEFSDSQVFLKEGSHDATFKFCNPILIKHPPLDKDVQPGEILMQISMDKELLKTVIKANSIYNQDSLSFEGDGEKMIVRTMDTKESDSDGAMYELGPTTKKFRYVLSALNLPMIADDYDVHFTDKMYVCFISKTRKLRYYIPAVKKPSFIEA